MPVMAGDQPMPEELILISPPVQAAGRRYYPIVRTRHDTSAAGCWVSATPVAILIEEKGGWSYSVLEENGSIQKYLALCR